MNEEHPSHPEPESTLHIDKVSVSFTQEGNTLGTTEEIEQITINLEFQLPGDDPFVVIKTDGWSLEGPEELEALIDQVKQVLVKKP